jgi:hypothetical protein
VKRGTRVRLLHSLKYVAPTLATIFALAALGLGRLAWQRQAELNRLKADTFGADERAAAQKRIWELEKRSRELEARLGGTPASQVADKSSTEPGRSSDPVAGSPGANKGTPSKQQILAFLNNPETQRTLNAKFREQVETRYSTLFKALNLSSAQLAQLKDLLVERQSAAVDVTAAAIEQGMKPDQDVWQELVTNAQTDTDRKLEAALSPADYAQFQNYESAQIFRGATTDLQRGLTRISTPLTDDQSEQFTQGIASLVQSNFSPGQQQALRQLNQLQQTRQSLQQVEQTYKEQQAPAAKPEGKGGG